MPSRPWAFLSLGVVIAVILCNRAFDLDESVAAWKVDPALIVDFGDLDDDLVADSDDILDYFYKNYQLYMSAYVKPFHLAEFIDDVDSQTRESTFLFLKEKYPETFQEIREVIEDNK